MRRRRKARTADNELRNLALAGRWSEVRALLAERLVRDPYDEEARAELERLRQGLPLRATESTLTRKRREEKEMAEELRAELALYRSHPDTVESWEPELLERRRKRMALIRSTLGNRLSSGEAEEAAAYHAALSALWARHRHRRRFRLLCGIGLPLLLLAVIATATGLHHRAQRAENALREALLARDIPRLEHALRAADSGINRLASRSLPEHIRQARVWLARTARQQAELREELAALETGQKHISTLPLARRAQLERTLHALPESMSELRERWQRLCELEARALEQQREVVMKRFREPLPPLPALSGNPPEDEARLRQQHAELLSLFQEWQAARELSMADDALSKPLQARLGELRQLRADIAALRRTLALLPSARQYAQYRQLMEQLTPRLYAPALRLTAIRDHLPDEGRLSQQMQSHGRELPPGMLEAARSALLEGGASFSPAFPANAQQLQLMEDLFSYTGLQKVLYELSAATLPSFIVEERPQVTEESVSFTPSPLTPGYTLDVPRRITWYNPQAVYIRRINATPLLRETGISRESFFRSANLPTVLDTLLRVEHEECPALARAYVFKRLLEVMKAHDWPVMLGIAYAPTLRADARSFARLTRELGIPLEAGCWLADTPGAKRAEDVCKRWLHERRHRRYAAEIARNFGDLVQVHPRFIGYMDEAGQPRLFRQLPEGTLLWYISEDGVTTSPLGGEAESPIPCSPIFTIAKD